MAAELVQLNVDVLIAVTTNAALAAKNATRTIPIFFIGVSDPVAAGLVDSLARPGGNITGLTNIAPVFVGQTPGVAQGNSSKALPCCGFVGSKEPRFDSTMERK
jgi:hypothetical protein